MVLLADEMLLETPLEVDESEETVCELEGRRCEEDLLWWWWKFSDVVEMLELNEESSHEGDVWFVVSPDLGDD